MIGFSVDLTQMRIDFLSCFRRGRAPGCSNETMQAPHHSCTRRDRPGSATGALQTTAIAFDRFRCVRGLERCR